MKFGKKGLIAEIAILLGVASITTVGLAAYVVTGGVRHQDVTVEEPKPVVVENNIVGIKAGAVQGKLNFQPTAEDSSGRLQSDGNGILSVTIPLDVEISEQLLKDYEIKVTVKAWDNVSKDTGAEVTEIEQYVVTPKSATLDLTGLTGQTGTNVIKGSKDLVLTWEWGTAFDSKDPCAWEQAKGETLSSEDLVSTLNAFQAAVAKVKAYQVSIDLSSKSVQAQ